MELSLTDVLTCPRCGPSYGLILLPGEVRDRRVMTGVLGCANCRERWGVEEGIADLRSEADPGVRAWEEAATGGVGEPDREAAVRLAALLGLGGGGGTVLVAGPAAAHAALLGDLVEDLTVVVLGEGAAAGRVDEGPSVLRAGSVVPLRSGSMRGVAFTGGRAEELEEGARLVGPAGRLVVEPAPAGAGERLEAAGLRILAAEAETVVAGRVR